MHSTVPAPLAPVAAPARTHASTKVHRRALLLATPLLSLLAVQPSRAELIIPAYADRNSAVVKSLQALERRRNSVRGDAETRLAAALGQLQRSRKLADEGSELEARGLLREGGMKSLRVDAAVFAKEVPAWNTELLNLYDAALKAQSATREAAAKADAPPDAAEAASAAVAAVLSTGSEFEEALRGVVEAAEAAARARVADSEAGLVEAEAITR